MTFNPGIVICSRTDSERLPNKVMRQINGVPVLVHLLRRVMSVGVPVVVAIPFEQRAIYKDTLSNYPELRAVNLFLSIHADDPLKRTADVQKQYGFSHVIRITHDKIFIDTKAIQNVLTKFKDSDVDYIYSTFLTPGTGFELISAKCLNAAADKYKKVEHISYAVRLTSEKTINYNSGRPEFPFNLLIDFPEDLKLMEVLFSSLGNNASLDDVITYLRKNPELGYINCPPIVSIYTCAFNAERWIDEAMQSVIQQTGFAEWGEYIIIDDHSSDKTYEKIAKFAIKNKNVTFHRNDSNVGLASSSNIALKKARGRYLLRLDADDYFTHPDGILRLLNHAQKTKAEIIYPNNWHGNLMTIQKGNLHHHVGGAMFEKKALNFVKFTDGLRNYEGLDLFVRAKDQLKISYYDEATFFYRQHPKSMSKTNLLERAGIKKKILDGEL